MTFYEIARTVYKILLIKSRRRRQKGNVARTGEIRSACETAIRSVGKSTRRWGNNIKMDLKKHCENAYDIHLAPYRDLQRAVMNTVMNLPLLYPD